MDCHIAVEAALLKVGISLLLFLLTIGLQSNFAQTVTFNTSGTWVVPAGVNTFTVNCWGGGGAGGSAVTNGSNYASGGGGAGGAFASKIFNSIPAGTSYLITVAGTQATSGANGNSSIFGSNLVVAVGGAGGGIFSANGGGGGVPGTGSSTGCIGDIIRAGGSGAAGVGSNSSNTSGAGGGGAGSSAVGGDASGVTAGIGGTSFGGNGGSGLSSNGSGNSGLNYGGGGSGGRTQGNTARSGGAGAQGYVTISYSCPTYAITSVTNTSVCIGNIATLTLSGNAANLPVGTYTVTYNLGAPNAATGLTATMNVTTAGTGTFSTGTLSNSGATQISITNLASGGASGFCTSSISSGNVATITVNPTSVGGSISASTSVCSGSNNGTLTLIGHTGTVVKWQSSTDGGTTWNDIVNTSTTQSYTNLTTTTQYRAVVQSGVCASANSSVATITVNPVSVGGSISGIATVCSGSNSGTLTLSGHTGAIVKWQSSTDGGTTWNDIANTSTTQSYTNLTSTTQYRAVVQSGVCASANSSVATITVNPTSVGGSINASTSVCSGSNSGTLTLIGHTGTIVKWQSSTDGGTTWNDIVNTSTTQSYTNLTTTTQYRAAVQSGDCASANSSVATITVNPVSAGGTISGSATVCSGINSGTLTLIGHTGTVVKWQSSTDGGTTWNDIANTSTTQSYTNLNSTTQYRAVVQSGVCASAISSVATITVNPVSVGGSINGIATVCSGSNSGTLTLSGHTGTIVKWQSSTDGGTTWIDIVNTSTTQSYTNLTTTTLYRAVVQSGVCVSANSSAATITVNPTPVPTQPANQTVCNGSNTTATTFISSVPGSTFTWANSNPAIGLAASGTGNVPVFTAVNTGTTDIVATITVTPSANGCTGISRSYTITVYPTPSVTLATPATQTTCSGSNITSIVFSGNVAGTTFSWLRDNPSGITGTGALANTSGTGSVTGTFSNSLSSQLTVNFSVTPSYNGCVGSTVNTIAEIKTNPVPTVSVAPATQTVCSSTATSPVAFTGTGTSYTWVNSNTSIGLAAPSGTGNIATFTSSNSGNSPATATITVTPVFTADGVSCNGGTQAATYVVNPIPALTSPVPNPSYVCSGSVFNYAPATAVTGINGGSAFAWTRNTVAGISNPAGSGNGSIAETLTNTISAAVNVTYNYTVSITHNSVTCNNPVNHPVVISVRPTPTVTVTPSILPDICSGGTIASAITISNPNNLAATTFSWSRTSTAEITGAAANGTGTTIAANTLVNNTTSTQSTIFTATAANNACSSSSSVTQVVYAPIGNNTTLPLAVEADICGISKQVTIAPGPATGGSGTYTYQWQMSTTGASDFVDIPGPIGTAADLVIQIPIAEVFFQRIVTSGTCSSVSDKRQVNKPISGGDLYITTSSSSYCQGGDGVDIIISNTVVAATYTLQYNNSGTWILAPISPNPLVGNGFSMTYPGIKTAGQYRVVAAISGSGGCTQTLNTITVSIDPLPAAPGTNNPGAICNGLSAILVATTSPASVNVNWYADNTTQTPLNGTPINSGTNYSVSPTSTTTYWAASVSNVGCISATRTPATVTVNPLPQMTSANSAVICTGGTVSIPLTNDVAGTPSYTWSATDNTNVTGESTTAQNSSTLSNTLSLGAGALVFQNVVYSVRATVNGCQGPAQTVTVRVDPRPQINSYSIAAICSGSAFSTSPNPASNTIPTNPATTYTWAAPTGMPPITGGSAQSTPQSSISQTLSNPTSSSASAVYTITPTAGTCVGNSFTVTVPVNPVPTISTLQNTIACSGTAFTFTPQDGVGGNIVPSGTLYSWALPTGSNLTGLTAASSQPSVNGNLTNTSNPSAVQTAVYSVTATAGSCTGTFTLNVAVNPTLKASIAGTYLKCQGSPAVVQVTITGTGNYSGQLSDGSVFSGTAATSPTTISVPLLPATVGSVTISQLTNTSTGCISLAADRTGLATVTALTGTAGLWTGAVSTDWFNCANWANGAVPDNGIDVQIAAGATNPSVIDPNSPFAPADKIARARNIVIDKALSINGIGGALYVAGNWQNNLGVSGFNAGVGEVRFISSTGKQTINTSGASENFYKLTIANTSNLATSDEVTLLKPVTVAVEFNLTKGRLLTTTSNTLTITNNLASAVNANGANDTYVNGPMRWDPTPGSSYEDGKEYVFPVGKPTGKYGAYRPVVIIPTLPSGAPGTVQPTIYAAEYFPTAGPGIGSRSFLGILNTEYWEISRPLGNIDAVVKLEYIKPGINSDWSNVEPCSTCNVAIAKQYGSVWNFTNYGSTSSGFDMVKPETRWAGDATGPVYSKLLSNFSPFTFGYDYNIVLGNPQTPVVRIKSFNAVLIGINGELDWNLDGASGVQKVDLEYSADGTNFRKLSSFGPTLYGFYQYTHLQLSAGKHFYRLVVYYSQTGKLVSETRILEVGKFKTMIHDLPITVVKSQLMLDISSATSQAFETRILSANGALLSTYQGQLNMGSNKQPINIPFLSQGLYIVQVRTQDGVSRTMKFMRE